MNYLIYKHTNKINGKSYIGLTKQQANKRWNYGNGYTKSNQPVFAAAIKKYGWENFEHSILEDNIESLEKANEKEKYWVSYYHTYIHDPLCNGYNMTTGGDGQPGRVMTDETKEKIRAIRQQKLIEKFPKDLVITIYNKLLTTDGYSLQKASKEYNTCNETLKKLFEYYSLDYGILYKKLLKHSEETKKILSAAAKKRDNSVYKNLPHNPITEETKKKISAAHKGKKLSAEQRQKIGDGNRGKKMSEEAKQKIGKANKGRKFGQDYCNNLKERFKDRKHITNGTEDKFVKADQVEKYLKSGWRLGRTKNKHEH